MRVPCPGDTFHYATIIAHILVTIWEFIYLSWISMLIRDWSGWTQGWSYRVYAGTFRRRSLE